MKPVDLPTNLLTLGSYLHFLLMTKLSLYGFVQVQPRLPACEPDQIVMAQGCMGLYTMCKLSAVTAPLCVVSVTHPDPTELSAYTPGVGLLKIH